jgi:hypothetical protein
MVVEEATQVIITNWRGFLAGLGIGWVLGFITMFTLYILYKVFPHMDTYLNLVKSYAQFMFKEKKKHLSEYNYFEERAKTRTLIWILWSTLILVLVLLLWK